MLDRTVPHFVSWSWICTNLTPSRKNYANPNNVIATVQSQMERKPCTPSDRRRLKKDTIGFCKCKIMELSLSMLKDFSYIKTSTRRSRGHEVTRSRGLFSEWCSWVFLGALVTGAYDTVSLYVNNVAARSHIMSMSLCSLIESGTGICCYR